MPAKKVPGKIYKTSSGQPYKILANGRARFIKRSEAGAHSASEPAKKRRRKKRTGGAARTGGSAMVGGGMGKHYLHY